MKSGIIRRLDDLGRIAVPKEIRRKIGADCGDALEFGIDGDKIYLEKYIAPYEHEKHILGLIERMLDDDFFEEVDKKTKVISLLKDACLILKGQETNNKEMTYKDYANIPMQENDADAKTIGEYLKKLLSTLWEQGEGFDGKRPFGNSGWEYEIYAALISADVIDGKLDEYGYAEEVDYPKANNIIRKMIRDIFNNL